LTGTPNDFIHQLLRNTAGGYNDPALARAPNHPFDLDLVAHEDTSAVELAGNIGSTPVYNFTVARVRYRALSNPAANVRVFFRMFQAATTATDFQPSTTYATGGIGASKIPLLGVVNGEVVSIPCFAAANSASSNATFTARVRRRFWLPLRRAAVARVVLLLAVTRASPRQQEWPDRKVRKPCGFPCTPLAATWGRMQRRGCPPPCQVAPRFRLKAGTLWRRACNTCTTCCRSYVPVSYSGMNPRIKTAAILFS